MMMATLDVVAWRNICYSAAAYGAMPLLAHCLRCHATIECFCAISLLMIEIRCRLLMRLSAAMMPRRCCRRRFQLLCFSFLRYTLIAGILARLSYDALMLPLIFRALLLYAPLDDYALRRHATCYAVMSLCFEMFTFTPRLMLLLLCYA